MLANTSRSMAPGRTIYCTPLWTTIPVPDDERDAEGTAKRNLTARSGIGRNFLWS
jgi:hypothetical protein